jgi:hypothetical protein
MFAKSTMIAMTMAALLSGMSAQAASIAGLVNTGAGAVGNVADANWTLNGGAAFTGGTNGNFPIGPWLADDTTSRWLTPTANAAASFDPTVDGLYTYTLKFSLAGFNPASAMFFGRFAADNTVDSIKLNGTTIGSGGNFSSWSNFASGGASFVAGVNAVDFVVRNFAQNGGNPTGLRVEFIESSVAAVPEPAAWAMLIVGFGIVGVTARGRRKSIAA